jgi:ATP-dependent Clp protease ATP-binding subunit ClpC
MEAKFSPRVKDVITYSREEALRNGNDYIGIEHLLLGIIREGEGLAVKILSHLGIDLLKLKAIIENTIKGSSPRGRSLDNIPLVKQAERVLKITYLEAKLFNSEMIGTEHLLLSILKDTDNLATKTLNQQGVDYDLFKEEIHNWRGGNPESETRQDIRGDLSAGGDEDEAGEGSFGSSFKKVSDKSKTPVLDNLDAT